MVQNHCYYGHSAIFPQGEGHLCNFIVQCAIQHVVDGWSLSLWVIDGLCVSACRLKIFYWMEI